MENSQYDTSENMKKNTSDIYNTANTAETESKPEIMTPAIRSGKKLARLREKKGYSVKELARQSGVMARTISKLEAGSMDLNKRPCDEIMQLVYAIGGRCRMEDLLCVERFDLKAYEEQCRREHIEKIKRLKVEQPEKFAQIKEEKARKKQELEEQQAKIKEDIKIAQEKLAEQMRILQEKQQKILKQSDDEDFELFDV